MHLTRGQIINVTEHSYADFSFVGTYAVTRDVNIDELVDEAHAEDSRSWRRITYLKERLIDDGILQPLPVPTLWLGDDYEPPEMQDA